MGQTFHEWAADAYADTLADTEAGRQVLEDYRATLTDPDHQDYVSAIGQPADGWTDGQAASFGRVHDLFADDLVDVMRVPVGHAPSVTQDRDADRGHLADLPRCFTTLVQPDTTDEGDGLLSWHPAAAKQLPGGWAVSCPLVIGHTEASRTLLHLADRGALARWPNGSDHLWVIGFTTFTAWCAWRDDSFAPLLADRTPDQ